MSLQAVRPYITDRMGGLGYTEHTDPFSDQNIPSSLLDGGFHQRFLEISGANKNNESQGLDVPVEVRCFFKGFRTPEDALTQSVINAEYIIADITSYENYSNLDPAINAVFLDSLSFDPYDEESNDNIVQVTFVFRFVVYVCL